jgi:hypothetical protein
VRNVEEDGGDRAQLGVVHGHHRHEGRGVPRVASKGRKVERVVDAHPADAVARHPALLDRGRLVERYGEEGVDFETIADEVARLDARADVLGITRK